MVVKFNKKIKVNKKSAVKAIRGIPTDFSLPSSYPNLLLWQTADEGVTTADALTQAITSATLTNTTLVGGQSTPFGGTDGYALVENVDTTQHHTLQFGWGAAVTRQAPDQEFDFYCKRGVGTRHLYVGHSTSHGIKVDLDYGTVVAVGTFAPAIYAQIDNVGSGWWRVRGRTNVGSTANLLIAIANNLSTSQAQFNGDGTSSLLLYSTQYGRQRQVSSWGVKAGSATVASAQSTTGSKPFLVECPTLGMRKIIGSDSTTKTLTDDPAIATALAGTDQPFTFCFLGRSASSLNCDILKTTGTTAQHTILAQNTSHGFAISRTDDTSSAAVPTFGTTDFTLDRNWHVFSVVFIGTQVELYIDGQKSPTTFSVNVGACTFTAITANFAGFYIREKAIYSRALNGTERNAIENGMLSRAGLPTPSLENPLNIPGIQGWWETDFGLTLVRPNIATGSDLTAWVGNGSAIATLQTPGTVPIYRIREAGAGDINHSLYFTPGGLTGTLRFSADFKFVEGGREWVDIALGANYACYNIRYGTIGVTSGVASSHIRDMGDGWYRIEFYSSYNGATNLYIYLLENDNDSQYTSDGRACYDVRNITITPWQQTNASVVGNSGDGSFRVFENSTSGTHVIACTGYTFSNGSTAQITCDVKKVVGGRSWIAIQAGTGFVSYFNLDTGALGTQTASTLTASALGDGWYRITLVAVPSTVNFALYCATADGTTSYAGNNGQGNFDVKNIICSQDRISGWLDKTFARHNLVQSTAASQPIYANSTFFEEYEIGDAGIFAPNAQRSLTNTSIPTIWNGEDKPLTYVGLSNIQAANVALATPLFQIYNGTTAYHYALARNTTGGVWQTGRKDTAGTTITSTYGNIYTGIQTISETFDGYYLNLHLHGTKIGDSQISDVGTITAFATFAVYMISSVTRGFCIANRALTDAERIALENGFRRRSGIATIVQDALNSILTTSPTCLLWGNNVVIDGTNTDVGNQISQWNDISGNSYNFTQSTQANQPTSFGYYLIHDPAPTNGEWVAAPSSVHSLLSGATETTVATINRRTDRTSACYSWRADLDLAQYFTSTSSEQMRIYFNGTTNHKQVSPGSLLNQWANLIVRFKRAEATDDERLKVYLNGTLNSGTVTGTFDANMNTIGLINVGSGATSTTGWRGDTALWILWNRALSDAEISTVNTAMAILKRNL